MTRGRLLALLTAAVLAGSCSSTAATRRTDQMDENPQVLNTPAPEGGTRFDVTRRPTRDEVGLRPGSRTTVIGKATEPPFTATLVTEGGDVVVRARDVVLDSEPADGEVAQLVVQLVVVGRAEREPELREHAPVLGLDAAKVDTFLGQAAQASASGSSATIATNLRGATTGGGVIEVVLRHNPNDDTIFENIQVTWLS